MSRADTQGRTKAAHVWQREPLEWYVEPEHCTAALLSVERFVGRIWDPACGGGNILKAVVAGGANEVYGTDIVRRSSWCDRELDFIHTAESLADNVITNPPFFRAKGTEAFTRKALSLATGKVAVFAEIRFLASGRRARGLFAEFPPTRIWQLADRPSCPPGSYIEAGLRPGGGTADWCWIVWDRTAPLGDTRFGWLRRPAGGGA